MIDKKILYYLLSTDGVNQLERNSAALDPTSVKIDGRTKQDILRFLLTLSGQINYYDLSNQIQGNWKPFLKELTSGSDIVDEDQIEKIYTITKNCPPHLALLLAFLKIYTIIQEDINKLSLKRLNFYYEDVLQIARRSAIGDQVHILFESGKNAEPVKLTKGTLLTAGTTPNGVPILYSLDDEYIITHANIYMLASDFVDQNITGQKIIYKTDDATSVSGEGLGWRPFGKPQLTATMEDQSMEPALLGCAVASPDFFLAEGRRIVTVKLYVRLPNSEALDLDLPTGNFINSLNIEMTGDAGWIAPDKLHSATLVSLHNPLDPLSDPLNFLLTVKVEFSEVLPAIVKYSEDVHFKRINTAWPVWSLTLKPTSFLLDILGVFSLSEIETLVEVTGVRDLVLQNDQSIQSVDAPVIPFGTTPRIGSNFYLGSQEVFSKSIKTINLNLTWQDVPEDMATYYAAYDNPSIVNSIFQSSVFLLEGKDWYPLSNFNVSLFNSIGNQLTKTIPLNTSNAVDYSHYKRNPQLTLGDSFNLSLQQGFIKLVLASPTKLDANNTPAYAPFEAFGHKAFPYIYSDHAIRIAKEEAGVVLPQPPYTPTLSSVTLDYTASNKFSPSISNQVDQFFSLDIFGPAESKEGNQAKLVPVAQHEGALYIGIEKAIPAQIISLLFQMEEGSTPGTELLDSETITWSYLSQNQWKTISKSNILEDKTQGLQVPGLIRILLGPDASTLHTLMPAGLHWLRASLNEQTDGAADVLAIHAQATRASLQLSKDSLDTQFNDHLTSPLAAETIKALKQKLSLIKKVSQPYPSFGGRPSETDLQYHQRIHERLRHRSRAVSLWDYERLILETFPEIYKVKGLPHLDFNNQLTPGHVKIVVVPDWKKRPTGNPLQPKANGTLLKSIESFVKENHCSSFTNVHVTNPVYETLLVDCKVSFNTGFDPGFYALQLEDEIKRFLSPWAYTEGEDIVFGGKIYASEIMAFIEGRPYVDYITDFALYHRYKGIPAGGISEMEIDVDFVVGQTPEPTIGINEKGKIINDDFIVGVPVDVASATLPDAILVSSNVHRIGVIAENSCEGNQQIGIGQMVIGLDFVLVS